MSTPLTNPNVCSSMSASHSSTSCATLILQSHFWWVIWPCPTSFSAYTSLCWFLSTKVHFLITWEVIKHNGLYVFILFPAIHSNWPVCLQWLLLMSVPIIVIQNVLLRRWLFALKLPVHISKFTIIFCAFGHFSLLFCWHASTQACTSCKVENQTNIRYTVYFQMM